LQEELASFVAAGLTPYEAIRAGTSDAARFLHSEAEFGTVAVGRRADLILLNANPLEDVGNVQKREGVMVQGNWLTEDVLKSKLEKISQTESDKAAVEGTVRDYEEAVQKFDFARADALLARNAKWIERSAPEAAAFGEGAGFWAEASATRVRVRNEPHDFDIHVQGDMAWVTLLVDVTMAADNEEARVLLARSETEETGKGSDPGQREWRATYTESEVLVKTSNGWRIALGHTSRLPTKPN
jgi:ketosteroid isomerase-like protein